MRGVGAVAQSWGVGQQRPDAGSRQGGETGRRCVSGAVLGGGSSVIDGETVLACRGKRGPHVPPRSHSFRNLNIS
ncbi:hypothetical protein AX27061_2829 [Achromobacter xylosoxidans NBRC 15126 = ATCC 27061]|nr:hypothetical protein AX27061_2829 [Achromobacter xylosoxidans NBRC 15126 = ATCC 27061]